MKEALKNTIAEELKINPEDLTVDTVLDDIEAWDSVAALTLMVILGDELGVPVTPGEMEKLKTFGDIELLVTSKQQP